MECISSIKIHVLASLAEIVSFLKAALGSYKRGKNCFWSQVQNIQIHNTHYAYSAYIGLHIYRSTVRCLHSPLQTNLTQRCYWFDCKFFINHNAETQIINHSLKDVHTKQDRQLGLNFLIYVIPLFCNLTNTLYKKKSHLILNVMVLLFLSIPLIKRG